MDALLAFIDWLVANNFYTFAVSFSSFIFGVFIGYQISKHMDKPYTVERECLVPKIGHPTRKDTIIKEHHKNGSLVDITCPYKGKNHFCFIDKEKCCYL